MRNKWFVMVTGASRGFGRCVAEEIVRAAGPAHSIDLLLIARTNGGLESTVKALKDIAEKLDRAQNIAVSTEEIDLGQLNVLEDRLTTVLSNIDPSMYSRAVLINNAGTIGTMDVVHELPSLSDLRGSIDMNVTSALWLSSRFARMFGPRGPRHPDVVEEDVQELSREGSDPPSPTSSASSREKGVIVNVSSITAIKPIETWSIYAAGKAAREMFHSVLGIEQEKLQGLRVLNYAPGPMDTDMSREVRECESFYHQKALEERWRAGELVRPQDSAKKLVRIALGGKFKPGEHVDYFDDETDPECG